MNSVCLIRRVSFALFYVISTFCVPLVPAFGQLLDKTQGSDPSANTSPKKPKTGFFSFLHNQPATECRADEELKEDAALAAENAQLDSSGKMVVGETIDRCRPNRATIVKDGGAILDMLERHIEEWGHASFSEVILMPDFEDQHDFSIDNRDTYSVYKNEIINSRQGAANIQETITNTFEGEAAYGKNSDTQRDFSILPRFGGGEASQGQIDAAVAKATVQSKDEIIRLQSELLTLQSTASPSKGTRGISPADLQVMASSTTVTGKVLNFMSNPINLSDIHQAYIGITQVSVSPGWRTQRDYFCEVQVAVEYARMNEEKKKYDLSLTDPTSLHSGRVPVPSVFAAFPLAQAQIMDQDYTSHLINSITLAASAQLASKPIKAAMFMNRMKDLKQTIGTTTALPVVVPSSDGKSITYRFQPSVHALADPTNNKSKPGWRMSPVSIPAMIVVICEKGDLVDWDHIGFTYSTRWVPMKINAGLDDLFSDRFERPLFPHKRQSNHARLRNSAGIDYLLCNYFWMLENQGFLPLETRSRVVNLRNLVRSHRHVSTIPAPAPHIERISPTSLTLDELSQNGFLISGDHFLGLEGNHELSQEDVVVRIDGVPMEICNISNNQILAKGCPETIGFLKDKVREYQAQRNRIDAFVAKFSVASEELEAARKALEDAKNIYKVAQDAYLDANNAGSYTALQTAEKAVHDAQIRYEFASENWRGIRDDLMTVQEMYAGGAMVTLQNRYGKCECSNHVWILPPDGKDMSSASFKKASALAYFPKTVTADQGDFAITVTGQGFQDEFGSKLITSASLGGVAAKEVKVLNSETVLVSFSSFTKPEALQSPTPLILTGISGVVKYEGGDTEFPMIQTANGPASSAPDIVLKDYQPKTADPGSPFSVTVTGSGFQDSQGNARISEASIGGVPGKVHVVNSGQIYITFPGGFGFPSGKSEPLIVSSETGVLNFGGDLPMINLEATLIPESSIAGFFPAKVDPKANFTITVTGRGFKDGHGNVMLKAASIGSLPANSPIDVINKSTVVLTFDKLAAGHQLNAEEPLILVGANGILNLEDPSSGDFPLIRVEGGKAVNGPESGNAFSDTESGSGGFWKSLGQFFQKRPDSPPVEVAGDKLQVTDESGREIEAPGLSGARDARGISSSTPSTEYDSIPIPEAAPYRFRSSK